MYTLLIALALTCPVEHDPGPLATYTETREAAERYDIAVPLASEIRKAAEREGLDPDLFFRLVEVESSFRPDVVSWAGAVGLAQVLPSTAQAMGVERAELFIPRVNLRVGARYLARLIERYGDVERALTAYHWGPGNVERGRFNGRYARQVLGENLRSYGNRVSLDLVDD